jgi:phage terminase large subunit-like protein
VATADDRASREYARAVRNPAMAAMAILRDRAELRLIDYVRLTWHRVDPGNPLRVSRAMEAICEHLEAVHAGQIRNLLINCPPGMSKSSLVDVFFPSWEWGPRKRPDLRYISWAYGEHLTERDNEKGAKLINAPEYRALWGPRRGPGDVIVSGFDWDPRQNTKGYYKNSSEGFRIASGVRGMGTGERADRLILDDPHSVMGARSEADMKFTRDWFTSTLTSRVRNANPYPEVVEGVLVQPSSTIVIMQRLAHDDISGLILEAELDFEHLLIEMEFEGDAHPVRARKSKKTGKAAWRPSKIGYVDWRYAEVARADAAIAAFDRAHAGDEGSLLGLCRFWLLVGRDVAMLADPVRFSRAAVESQREVLLLTVGTNAVAAQFRQYPSEGSGDMFKHEDWQYVEPDQVPARRVPFDVRGWDLAASTEATSDGTGSVRMRWGVDGNFYVMHAHRVRLGPGGVKTERELRRTEDGPRTVQDFPQDPGQAGVDQVRGFAAEAPGTVTASSPESGSKVVRASPLSAMQQHHRVFLVRGPWNAELVEEYGNFPNSRMSALVDAGSRAFNRLASMRHQVVPGGSVMIDPGKDTPADLEQRAEKMREAMNGKPRHNPNYRGPEIDDEVDDDNGSAW